MKIAIVVNEFPKISEAFIVRQAQKLNADIITLAFNEGDSKSFNIKKTTTHAIESGRSVFQKIKDKFQGVPCRIWTEKERTTFHNILKTSKPDAVLATFGPNGINVMEACSREGIPYFVQFLGYDASELMQSNWYKEKILKVINYSAGAIVLYEGMQQTFVQDGGDPKKFTVLNIGVPTDRFAHIKPDYYSQRPTHFLAVGRLVEKKSPVNLLNAFLVCARENNDVVLNIVGNGALMPEVREFLENEPLIQDKVRLHGFLSQDELLPLYQQSHVFVQHSITASDGNKEGWPVGIAEACSCSLPVVSTKHAGIPEQVIDGETGFLVPENDYEGMGKRMLALSQNWEMAETMGQKARQHIFNHGDLDNQIGKLKKLLESVIKTSLA